MIGEFDEQGKCDVDRDNNLLIVHPDILVSGTRVIHTFLSELMLYISYDFCSFSNGGCSSGLDHCLQSFC